MESHLITARYGSVPLYKIVLRVVVWLLAFVYAFWSIYLLFSGTQLTGFPLWSRAIPTLAALLSLVVFVTFAELFLVIVDLLLDIEDHARRILDKTSGERSGTTPKL